MEWEFEMYDDELLCSPSWWLRIKLHKLAMLRRLPRLAINPLVKSFGNKRMNYISLERALIEVKSSMPAVKFDLLVYTIVGYDDWGRMESQMNARVPAYS